MGVEKKTMTETAEVEVDEPLSPCARLFHSPHFNTAIIFTVGVTVKANIPAVIEGLKHTFANHPRFSSILMSNGKKGKRSWVRTKVNVEDHVIVPDIDPNIEDTDQYLEDYISNLTTVPMDLSKPLWEIHMLLLKTSNAESVGVFKIHHSLGDGMSLMSLFLACTRKTSDPEALPTFPVQKKCFGPSVCYTGSFSKIWWLFVGVWFFLRLVLNTFVDLLMFSLTICFLRDTETPLLAKPGSELNPRRLVHRIISFHDVMLVKNAMNMTINDVLLGVTQAGLSRYLSRRYEQEAAMKLKKESMRRIRLRSAIMVNLRPNTGIEALADMMAKKSKCRWGNDFGYILLPISLGIETDPLEYLRKAKVTIDRKKHSLESVFSMAFFKLAQRVFGLKASVGLISKVVRNTTFTFSNVVGPKEEVTFHGHPVSYIAPTVFGYPHSLILHYQSYVDKIVISASADPAVIPDPLKMCDDFVESLNIIKSSVLGKGLNEKEV